MSISCLRISSSYFCVFMATLIHGGGAMLCFSFFRFPFAITCHTGIQGKRDHYLFYNTTAKNRLTGC
jgi:hypothetical protein